MVSFRASISLSLVNGHTDMDRKHYNQKLVRRSAGVPTTYGS